MPVDISGKILPADVQTASGVQVSDDMYRVWPLFKNDFKYLMSWEMMLCPHRYSQSLMKFVKSLITEEWKLAPFHLTAPMSNMRPFSPTSRSIYAMVFMSSPSGDCTEIILLSLFDAKLLKIFELNEWRQGLDIYPVRMAE